MGRKSKDYTGLIFGDLTVIGKTNKKDSKGNYLWECKCKCGNTCYYVGAKLPTRKTCGCSHIAIDENSYIDKIINNWYILDKSYKTDKGWMMKCECVCGTIKDVNIYNLINNKTKDCGCGRKSNLAKAKRKHTVESLKNRKFGKLTVIAEAERDKYGKIKYLCKCDCGNNIIVLGRSLLQGSTNSCGCIHSLNNARINSFINSLNYETIQEKSIKLANQIVLRFDVYVPELNLAIEYDGEQHYIPIDFAGKGQEWAKTQLKRTQELDQLKNAYCKFHNIHLLRISYHEKDDIEEIILNKINSIANND